MVGPNHPEKKHVRTVQHIVKSFTRVQSTEPEPRPDGVKDRRIEPVRYIGDVRSRKGRLWTLIGMNRVPTNSPVFLTDRDWFLWVTTSLSLKR